MLADDVVDSLALDDEKRLPRKGSVGMDLMNWVRRRMLLGPWMRARAALLSAEVLLLMV